MNTVTVTLPWPPSVNKFYGRTATGQLFLSPKFKKFYLLVKEVIWREFGYRPDPIFAKGGLAVTVDLMPPDKRKRDIDNIQKAILDSLTKAKVWTDDSQVKHISVTMQTPMKGGSAMVTVSTMEI